MITLAHMRLVLAHITISWMTLVTWAGDLTTCKTTIFQEEVHSVTTAPMVKCDTEVGLVENAR